MATLIIPTRKVVLAAMKQATPLTALVPVASIYPETTPDNPDWPFLRWDGPSSIPIKGACFSGAEVSFMVHAFAKPFYDGTGRMIETAADHCGRIMDAAHDVLNGNRFESAGRFFRVRTPSTISRQDRDESDAWHCTINCVARVL